MEGDGQTRKVLPEVQHVRVRLEGVIQRYIAADQNLALVETLIESDVGQRLDQSMAAHGYNRLLHTLYLDVIKDLWAITLDTNKDSASLLQLKRLVANDNTRNALREEYARPLDVNFVGEGEPPAGAREAYAEAHRKQYRAQFDEIYPRVVAAIDDVRTNGRMEKLEQLRHQVIAHARIDTDGKTPQVVQVDRFQIHWKAAEPVFEDLEPLLRDAALIFTSKNYGSVRYKNQHREWMVNFWERIRALGKAIGE